MTATYRLDGRWEACGDEIHVHGDEGGGILAFKTDAVTVTADGIDVPEDVAPRLVEPPQDDGPGAAEAPRAFAAELGAAATEPGSYCICIGQTCYIYNCDNKYYGICGTNCAYYDCKTDGS